MSHSRNHTDTGPTTAFYQGVESGEQKEHERITDSLKRYFELTQEADEYGKITNNPEWDRGYQAAMAIVEGSKK